MHQRPGIYAIPAEREAGKPDAEALANHIRAAMESLPQPTSTLGWYMRREVKAAMIELLKQLDHPDK